MSDAFKLSRVRDESIVYFWIRLAAVQYLRNYANSHPFECLWVT